MCSQPMGKKQKVKAKRMKLNCIAWLSFRLLGLRKWSFCHFHVMRFFRHVMNLHKNGHQWILFNEYYETEGQEKVMRCFKSPPALALQAGHFCALWTAALYANVVNCGDIRIELNLQEINAPILHIHISARSPELESFYIFCIFKMSGLKQIENT